MAKQASANATKQSLTNDDLIFSLQQECFAMSEILEEVSDVGSFIHFFSHINRAFELLMKEDSSAFRTYVNLTTMFRVFEKHQDIVNGKRSEISAILSDLDILDEESVRV